MSKIAGLATASKLHACSRLRAAVAANNKGGPYIRRCAAPLPLICRWGRAVGAVLWVLHPQLPDLLHAGLLPPLLGHPAAVFSGVDSVFVGALHNLGRNLLHCRRT
jgi:hypothetical protein